MADEKKQRSTSKKKNYFVSTKPDMTFLPEEEWVDLVLMCSDERDLERDLKAVKPLVDQKVVRLINAGRSDKLKKLVIVFSVVETRVKDLQKVVTGSLRPVQ